MGCSLGPLRRAFLDGLTTPGLAAALGDRSELDGALERIVSSAAARWPRLEVAPEQLVA